MTSLAKKGFHYAIVIIIVMAVVIVGLLAYVFWQSWQNNNKTSQNATNITNTVQNQTNTNTANTNTTTAPTDQLTYSNSDFTFSYPKTGWTVSEGVDNEILVTSSDYEIATNTTDYRVTKGAMIGVGRSIMDVAGKSMDQVMNESMKTYAKSEPQKTTVDGLSAYYCETVRGVHHYAYDTELIKDGRLYVIGYDSAGGKDSSYYQVYNSILSSLHIK